MFLGLRELAFARGRFGLMGLVVALIALLVVVLSGLSSGLVDDGISGLQQLPVTAFAFDRGTQVDSAFSRSTVDMQQAAAWRRQPGVADVALFGNALVNATAVAARTGRHVPVDLALFGVAPRSFLAPRAARGSGLTAADPTGIVISATLEKTGVSVGDTVVVDRLGTRLTVVGVTAGQRTFGHVEVAYTPLRTWQQVHAGARPGDPVPPAAYRQATAVALRAQNGASLDLAAGDAAARTTSRTLEQSYASSPGYTAETSTLTLIRVFLYVISALVIGAFFTVWTIHRRHELAVIRAMGAGTGSLVRDTVGQAAFLLVGATAVGLLVGLGAGALLSGTSMPFALEAAPLAGATVSLIALGLVGAAAAALRITRIDPLAALGGQR